MAQDSKVVRCVQEIRPMIRSITSVGRGKTTLEEETNRTDSSRLGSPIGVVGGVNGLSGFLCLSHEVMIVTIRCHGVAKKLSLLSSYGGKKIIIKKRRLENRSLTHHFEGRKEQNTHKPCK